MIEDSREDISLSFDTDVAAKRKFRTRIHPEILFAGLVTTTFLASTFVVLFGYVSGLSVFSAPWDIGVGLQISLSVATIYTLLFFLIERQSAILSGNVLIVRRSCLAWFASFMVLSWTVFLLKESAVYSRIAILCCFLTGLLVLPLFHLALSHIMSRLVEKGQIWFQQIALVGLTDLDELQKIEAELAPRGIYVARRTLVSIASANHGGYLSRCREVALEIQSTLLQLRLDGIWIVTPINEQRRFDELCAALTQVPLPIVLLPNKSTQRILRLGQVKAGSYFGYEVRRAPLTRIERAAKRIMDIIIAASALIVLSPIFILTAIAILIESGRPVFFRQDRKGFGGRPFKILKFRSMRVQENGLEIRQAVSSDPRVTPLGNILRRTSVDELPQLFNVLKGEMSIVGPRPHAIAHDNFYDRIIATYAFRHHVKPGITGWAQVNGYRGNTAELASMEGRVEHDIWYINHWSVWLDLRIMLKTALEVLWHKGAY